MEEKQRLYEIIKQLSEENLRLFNVLKDFKNELSDYDLMICDNCGSIFSEDDMCKSDFITSGGEEKICMQCVENGYGK